MEMDPFFAVTDAVDNSTPSTTQVVKEETETTTTSLENDNGSNNPDDKNSILQTETEETPKSLAPKVMATKEATAVELPSNKKKHSPEASLLADNSSKNNNMTSGEVNHVELANEEIANLLMMGKGFEGVGGGNKITLSQVNSLQHVLRENGLLKNKVAKLKSLLQRSAKAQKGTKTELVQSKIQLNQAQEKIVQLQRRVESLCNRPTHMDLLADFESNFDKALLSFPASTTTLTQQSGGQTSSSEYNNTDSIHEGGMIADNSLLMSEDDDHLLDDREELIKANTRIQQLESRLKISSDKRLNLQDEIENLQIEKDALQHKCQNLQLECQMAKLEMERSARAAKEKSATLSEMQLEMNLMYKSVSEAYAHAAHATHTNSNYNNIPNNGNKYDLNSYPQYNNNDKHPDESIISFQQAEEMKAKMEALQEWALASANVKSLLNERIANLTDQVKALKRQNKLLSHPEKDSESAITTNSNDNLNVTFNSPFGDKNSATPERVLWSQTYSLVVGAGLVGGFVVDLGHQEVLPDETIILQYKFDITPTDTDIDFSILKGRFEDNKMITRAKRYSLETVLSSRTVVSGGAGEVQCAFAVQNACTLVWSNEKSWIRPKTIKFYLQAVAIE